MRRLPLTILLALLLPGMGCWILSDAADHAADRAAENTVDNSMSKQQAQDNSAQQSAAMASMGPMMDRIYTRMLLAMAFSAGGYAPEESPYKVGQFTRWTTQDKNGTLVRAHLFDDAKGNQWWKVKWVDNKKNQTVIMEALFSPDRSKLLRLRAKMPNDKAPKEIPVEENTYAPPEKLTPESLKGADKGKESVTVPAGTFDADHYVFGDMGSGTSEFWTSSKVPGGVVKQEHKGAGGDAQNTYDLVLAAYGTGAKSELGTKP